MDANPRTPTIESRFLTIGGAAVAIYRDPAKTTARLNDRWWRCLGCHADHNTTTRYPDPTGVWLTEGAAREEANSHAGQCRSMPQEAED